MDRFKFRVYIKYAKMMCYDVNSFYIDRLKNKITIHFNDHTKTFKFDDVVLEQSTGLKDKNDKLIYENDVVEYYNEKIHQNFREEVLPFRELRTKGIMRHLIDERNADKLEVIGNIHENENLLEI